MLYFSFIIPHKNTPALLQKCLDSIPHRDDVEIIVVDDNSDESKVDFEHFPGLDDPIVKIIFDKKGGGCAHATNIAMDNAKGKWIIRADADDFFCDDIEIAMNEYLKSDYDIIYFKGRSVNLPDFSPSYRADTNNMAIDQATHNHDYRYLFSNSCPWCKFYNRAFIEKHNLRLHEVRWSTEVTFCAQIACLTNNYCASPLTIYCVTDSAGTMVKDASLECRIVRFQEDCSAVKILRPLVGHFEFLHFWMFRTWFNIYEINKIEAIKRIPQALWAGHMDFVKQAFNAKFKS